MKLGAIASLTLPLLLACAIGSENSRDSILSWSDYRDQKSTLDGQYVTLCGWFVAERDVCALYDSQEAHAQEIWIRPKSEICLPVVVFERPTRSWAKVTGLFHSGRGYGLFGHYESAITNADVELSNCNGVE